MSHFRAGVELFELVQGLLQADFLAAALQLKLRTQPQSQGISAVRSSPASEALTIGRLARAADVGVETIRYYQDRQLLPVPPSSGAFRYYPVSLIERIRFIKQAQELGFSLEEIRELLQLEDGADRASIRRIAADRLLQIEAKLKDLKRMQRVLNGLLTECEHTNASLPCPIIGTIRDHSRSPMKRRRRSSEDTSKHLTPAA
jgi:MerR family mercuric resistance operon transcriptional regulator